MPIQARTLRDQIREELLKWLAEGRLVPGQRLEEARLTGELGVSRTPLREALRGMEQEGLVDSSANRGFRVASLDPDTVQNLFPIIGTLSALALRLGGAPDHKRLIKLKEIGEGLINEHVSPRQRALLDRQWHDALTGWHGNRELARQLSALRLRVIGFDRAWLENGTAVSRFAGDYSETLKALSAAKVQEAARLAESHWHYRAQVVLEWLSSEQPQEEVGA